MSRLGLSNRKLMLLRPCIVSILVTMAMMPGSITSTWASRDTGQLTCTGWISFQLIIYGAFCSASLGILCHPKRPQSLSFPQISCRQHSHLMIFLITMSCFGPSPWTKGNICLWPSLPSSQVSRQRCYLTFCSLTGFSFISALRGCPLLQSVPYYSQEGLVLLHFISISTGASTAWRTMCKPSSSVLCYFYPILGNLSWDHPCELREN